MNTWKQKSRLTQANLTSEPSANLTQEQSPMVRYFQEAAAGEQSHPLELDKQMRSRMERQFGLDFSAVRLVESDLPGKLGADAIAQGDLIRFAPGAFHPETAQGEQLLSHELSHVVQQSRGQGMGGVAGMPWVDAGTESSADAMADQAMNGGLAAEPARSISPAPAASAPMLCGRTRQGKSKPPLGRRKRRPIPYHQKSQPSDLKLSYYERRAARENRNQFNPQDHSILGEALTAIDKAKDVGQAKAGLNILLKNKIGGMIGGSDSLDINLRSVKLRLKGIARMMMDFPQLDGQIQEFGGVRGQQTADKNTRMIVSLNPSISPSRKYDRVIGWGALPGSYMYGKTDEEGIDKHFTQAYQDRKKYRGIARKAGWSAASGRWDGTHELGHIFQHMLSDQLLNPKLGNATKSLCSDLDYIRLITHSHFTAASVVQRAISQLLQDQNLDSTTRKNLIKFIDVHTSPKNNLTPEKRSEQLDLLDYSSMIENLSESFSKMYPKINEVWNQKAVEYKDKLEDLYEMGLTSKYGSTGIAELFAEAFPDYYGNGDNASALSKKIVEIVRDQTALDDKLACQQGVWVDNERSKASAILKELPTLEPMKPKDFQEKRDKEKARKGKRYIRPRSRM